MRYPTWVKAREIDDWAKTMAAKPLLPELLRRLVLATVDRGNLQAVDFPAYEEIQRPGFDGRTLTDIPTPFVPSGKCVWELSCDGNPRRKADEDYNKRLEEIQEQGTRGISYIAVTARDWIGAADWAEQRTAEGKFKEVRAYDSSRLEQWLLCAPAVSLWLAEQLGKRTHGVTTVRDHWRILVGTLKKAVPPELLLLNREGTAKAFADWSFGNPGPLAVRAPSPQELVDVFVAWVHTLPSEQADVIASRAIVVNDAETWRSLATSKEGLIMVAGPHLDSSAELLAEAKGQGHHVLRFAAFTESKRAGAVEMERMRVHDLTETLKKIGIDDREATRFARGSGGNFTIFRRLFAGDLSFAEPDWAKRDDAPRLAALLLAAAWTSSNSQDRLVIEQLTNEQYSEIETFARQLRQVTDPPLRQIRTILEFVSPQDAWILLHGYLTGSRVETFESLAIKVLSESRPELDLPAEKRIFAAGIGDHLTYSEVLRRGLAEILSLSSGMASEDLVEDEFDFVGRARRIVREILPRGCDWKRWASINDLLPYLAESAPEEFLDVVAQDLRSEQPALVEPLRQENGGTITGLIYHAGVLWALEALAWSPKYVATVSDLLAKFAALDPGGKWTNRPKASLRNLFFSWRPQTMATVDELLAVLRRLTERQPEVAWELLLDLFPKLHSTIMDSYKPSPWRSWATGWTGEVAAPDYSRYVRGLVDLAIALVSANNRRWPEIFDHASTLLPEEDRARIFRSAERIDAGLLNDEERISIWQKLQQSTRVHAAYLTANWALPASEVTRLASLRDKFAPQDEVENAAPIFGSGQLLFEDSEASFEEREKNLRQRRNAAAEQVWNKLGISGVLELARKVEQSWLVGIALAEAKQDEPGKLIFPDLLCSSENHVRGLAAGYTATRIDQIGQDLAEKIPSSEWTPEQIASFACRMPFNLRAWNWVKNIGPDVEKLYWADVRFSKIPGDSADVEKAARELVSAGRPAAAVEFVGMSMIQQIPVSSALLFYVLEALLQSGKEEWRSLESYYVQAFIKRLQADASADVERLGPLEFGFLPILGRHMLRPQTLEALLARDPKFFVSCLRELYRGRNEPEVGKAEDPDGQVAARAQLVWQLLRGWQKVPGTQPDGSIAALELRKWIQAARNEARETERLEVCDIKIGEILAYAPSDDAGVKPCIPVREAIEAFDSDEIERGFTNGLYNLRGISSRGIHDGGQQERELAATYEGYARACDAAWPRTARALRRLAEIYLREAEVEDAEAQMRK
jgi:hypothetical protein